ncbi:MAG: biopolymer transporter ExbD [Bacteroidota bacterium]|nr:biopolymer transporter ExbD [Bacteroidota bacterium]
MAIKRTTKINAEFSMSSLTDIIFLLLIFFMLTSTFVAPNAIKLLLPKATGQTMSTQSVTVSVNENLEYFVEDQQVSLNQISTVLDQYLTGSENEAIVLRADKSIDYGDFVNVLKACNNKSARVVIATRPD